MEDGSIVSSDTTCPSALETIFWATTKISPLSISKFAFRVDWAMISPKSNSDEISGIPGTARIFSSFEDILYYPTEGS